MNNRKMLCLLLPADSAFADGGSRLRRRLLPGSRCVLTAWPRGAVPPQAHKVVDGRSPYLVMLVAGVGREEHLCISSGKRQLRPASRGQASSHRSAGVCPPAPLRPPRLLHTDPTFEDEELSRFRTGAAEGNCRHSDGRDHDRTHQEKEKGRIEELGLRSCVWTKSRARDLQMRRVSSAWAPRLGGDDTARNGEGSETPCHVTKVPRR